MATRVVRQIGLAMLLLPINIFYCDFRHAPATLWAAMTTTAPLLYITEVLRHLGPIAKLYYNAPLTSRLLLGGIVGCLHWVILVTAAALISKMLLPRMPEQCKRYATSMLVLAILEVIHGVFLFLVFPISNFDL